MTIILWILVFLIFLYTIGFALTLWKDKNKVGSIAVFILALVTIIIPFFSSIR